MTAATIRPSLVSTTWKGGESHGDQPELGLVTDGEAPIWGGASLFDAKARARFWMKVRVAPANACWDWLAALDRYGYGKFTVKSRIFLTAHRTAFLLSGRSIPGDLQLDHLCRNRACCNPDHLEPVTNAENHRRGYWGTRTTCLNEHPWTEANTGTRKGRSGDRRYCLECKREESRRRRARSRSDESCPYFGETSGHTGQCPVVS